MKKLVYLFVLGFMFNNMYAVSTFRPAWKFMDEPVKLSIRGVDFFIFPSGDFDFNTHQRNNPYYYNPGAYGVRIEKDRYGKIRRVGNVFINYNRYGQVRRIGNVFIQYNDEGFVRKIGHLHLKYRGNRYRIFRHNPYMNTPVGFYYEAAPGYSLYYNGYNNHNEGYGYDYSNENDYYYRGKKEHKKSKTKRRRNL